MYASAILICIFIYGIISSSAFSSRTAFSSAKQKYYVACSYYQYEHPFANCQKLREDGNCERHSRRMRSWCPRTCKFCYDERASAPAVCSKSRYGCCQDKVTSANGPNRLGCPEMCKDEGNYPCKYYQRIGFCDKYHSTLRKRCAKSCGFCGDEKKKDGQCIDIWNSQTCKTLSKFGTCVSKRWRRKMSTVCKKTCRVCTHSAPILREVVPSCAKQGCCWDKTTPVTKGCPSCKDFFAPVFCNRFKHVCHKLQKVNGVQVRIFCPSTCGLCDHGHGSRKCRDDLTYSVFCKEWQKRGRCKDDPLNMGLYCKKTCGFCKSK